ncbi:MAG TPA: GNAT family N-acetyltransferase [Opitutaceae bacterium]
MAAPADAGGVWSVLTEAAGWQEAQGTPLWLTGELDEGQVRADVAEGRYRVAEVGAELAGVIKVQMEDPLFWPDLPEGRAVYVHRLAVRRRFAGGGVSQALLRCGVDEARRLGRSFVRLDTPTDRPRLRAVYERFGFRHHSDRQVGPYFVARYEMALPRPSAAPLWTVAVLVGAGLLAAAMASRPYAWSGPAASEPYNLAADGFRAGHLWLAREAPPGLAAVADPYRFAAYRPYLGPPWSLTDLSYYRGHLYSYFGVTPAVLAFWPFRVIAGRSLHQAVAVLLFCEAGFGLMAALAAAAWRRYFPGVGSWKAAAGVALLGSVSTLPVLLARPGAYEVSISCGFLLSMASLGALWMAWHGRRPGWWTAAASLAFGLAVGSRPNLLFCAPILLFPAVGAFRARRPGAPGLLAAALLPIAAVGAGLAAYNAGRFGDPLQFGHAYQLSGNDVYGSSSFSAAFLWDNLRLYFLEIPRWHGRFPFVWAPALPALSARHLPVEFVFGVLPAFPVLLAALIPSGRGFFPARLALGFLFLAAALPVCLYAGATSRYLVDFLPALALLAAAGFWSVRRGSPLVPLSLAALAFSVATAWLLASALVLFYRGAHRGASELAQGRIADAAATYDEVTRINPGFRGQAELGLGTALLAAGRRTEAIAFFAAAGREDPHLGAAFFNLGRALLEQGRPDKAADAFSRAAAIDPYDGEAEAALGVALFGEGRRREAVEHERAALRIEPTLDQARENLRAFGADH